jgi:hypothetical protein
MALNNIVLTAFSKEFLFSISCSVNTDHVLLCCGLYVSDARYPLSYQCGHLNFNAWLIQYVLFE